MRRRFPFAPPGWLEAIALAAALPVVAGVVVMSKRRLSVLIGLPLLISVYAAVKVGLVYVITGAIDRLSVPELAIAGSTLGLGLAVLAHVQSLQDIVNDLFGGALGGTLRPFSEGQTEIYKEIRRARVYQRPLTLIVFSNDGAKPTTADPFEHPDAVTHPFTTNFYQPRLLAEANVAEAESQQLWQQGGDAGRVSRGYVLITVLLATALFCGGTAPKFDVLGVRRAVLWLGLGTFIFAAVRLLSLPAQL